MVLFTFVEKKNLEIFFFIPLDLKNCSCVSIHVLPQRSYSAGNGQVVLQHSRNSTVTVSLIDLYFFVSHEGIGYIF